MVIFVLLDILITEVGPKMLFGTKDLEVFPDFFKRMILVIALTWMFMPFSDWLRDQLSDDKRKLK